MSNQLESVLVLVISSMAFCQSPSPGESKPPYLQKAIEKGAKGDIFDRLKANDHAQKLRLPEPFQMGEKALMKEMGTLAKAGDPRAILFLGSRDYHQLTDPVMKIRGEELIRRAANLGYAEAQAKWSEVVLLKQQDAKESQHWHTKAVEGFESRAGQGDVEAMYLAGMWSGGRTGDSQPSIQGTHTTEYWLRMAAERGHIPAAAALGSLLTDSTRRTEDEQREAWKWLQVAGNAGDPSSLVRIGREYATKDGQRVLLTFIHYDPTMAWQWWDRAIVRIGKQEVMELLEDLQESGQLPPRPNGLPPF